MKNLKKSIFKVSLENKKCNNFRSGRVAEPLRRCKNGEGESAGAWLTFTLTLSWEANDIFSWIEFDFKNMAKGFNCSLTEIENMIDRKQREECQSCQQWSFGKDCAIIVTKWRQLARILLRCRSSREKMFNCVDWNWRGSRRQERAGETKLQKDNKR